MDLNVIYEDNHIIVVEKIRNVLSQADNTKDLDMLSLCKNYIKDKYNKPGNVFLGLVHRLDRPVGGVMIFAKTSKAASRLSDQVRRRKMKKTYYAVVNGKCNNSGEYVDYLFKDKKNNMVKIVKPDFKEGKKAVLSFELLDYNKSKNLSLVKINLETGRPHQIRVQFSSRGFSLYGDQRYSKIAKVGEQIALWSQSIEIEHPTLKKEMKFEANTPNEFPWNLF